jgi:hypothetical protein
MFIAFYTRARQTIQSKVYLLTLAFVHDPFISPYMIPSHHLPFKTDSFSLLIYPRLHTKLHDSLISSSKITLTFSKGYKSWSFSFRVTPSPSSSYCVQVSHSRFLHSAQQCKSAKLDLCTQGPQRVAVTNACHAYYLRTAQLSISILLTAVQSERESNTCL